ncbi:aldose 1-epimerase family protein [Sphingomonas sp. LaA6.9]|uniref:aldose 1-epimerase family protein n=1 Tax=Sphingomonas sp. LaA6.9 TaxID=2919914 RepID=UPI001F4FBA1B|nr:aldose 1-epimerase family protein [Sphingomonas sp. LaA6.9]MCJ8159764.1 aldose 1-epimerase family protein [Sphingomonas sp. LaA6.9]
MAEKGAVSISSGDLTARIAPLGAELVSLTDAEGRELMSDGDPAFWTGRAPILFPIVGRLNRDEYRLGDRSYSLPQHGFARRSDFTVVAQDPDAVRFRLVDSPETRSVYPFAFVLDMAFHLDGPRLTMIATIGNPGSAPMPASFGFHPAFAWPLPYGGAREDHRIVFEKDEPAELRAIVPSGVIADTARPSPVEDNVLALGDNLFTNDALIWDKLESRALRYGASEGPQLEIAFPDTEWLGIWTKPGTGFVCIEPWAGMADPEGFDGDFSEKPGVFIVAPGESRSFRMIVTLKEN